MQVDVRTNRVVMRSDWDGIIDAWVERCRQQHPEVARVELTLGRDEGREAVAVVATTGGRRLRATGRDVLMGFALHDALDTLERELLVRDAIRHAADPPRPS
jgi:hypothetical protein